MKLTCRFYKNHLPDVEELVMVNVAKVEELSVYVNLLEYNDIQGMILLSELSRRRIRSINKLVRVGKDEAVVVTRVDRKKGFIDLSKCRVSSDEAVKCVEKFHRGKAVNHILRLTALALGLASNDEFEELYSKTAWFYDEKHERRGVAYDVFSHASRDESELKDCPVDANTKKALVDSIRHHFSAQSVKCRADIEVACYEYEGIDAVKAALHEGLNQSTEDLPIKINLIAPPLYTITTTCLNGKEGVRTLQTTINKIKESIEKYRGVCRVKIEPQVFTEAHEKALEDTRAAEAKYNQKNVESENDSSDEDDNTTISGLVIDNDVEEE
ncbi:unnamed protein product [Adineta ricciae]|uniref:Eukaryotic translation initiation factor 2 subunit 1 n=1 Tax=Adineta ricciae TaxID=249248 RepID=A0A814E9F1_ADIRI|nr:unnamed protein product [Adineta ricciae]